MKRFTKNFLAVCTVIIILSGGVFACSCAAKPPHGKSINEVRSEKRNYFLNEFSGAAFVGRIVKRERVNVNWIAKTLAGEPAVSQMYKYTIRVTEYWLGVKSPTIIVYGEPVQQIFGRSRSSSSCGFELSKGRTYFFTPEFYERENLTIDQCDYAHGGSDPNENPATEFRKIMGEPKRF